VIAEDNQIETYGCPVKCATQLDYWRWAYAWRNAAVNAPPRPTLFRNIAEALVPGWFEWHSWTNRVVDVLGRRRWSAFSGCSNCVAGHTKILNPITGETPTIEDLCRNRIAPTVMTIEGPRQAGIPFIKGIDELFEVRLENGSVFFATADHIVLSPIGFVPVKSLALGQRIFAYDSIHRKSTSELVPSTHASSALGSRKTVEGSLYYCSQDRYRDDEQLLRAREACRLPFPSQDDVPKHNPDDLCLDASGILSKHSPFLLHTYHPSISNFVNLHSSLDSHEQRPHDLRILERAYRWFLPPSRFPSRHTFPLPSSTPTLDCACRHLACSSSGDQCLAGLRTHESGAHQCEALPPCDSAYSPAEPFEESKPCGASMDWEPLPIGSRSSLGALSLKVVQASIVSIRSVGENIYYDISVPGPEHYFAEGTIHHNSAKTRNVTGFACNWWLAAPEESSVILCSTTMKMLKKRGWAEVQNYAGALEQTLGEPFGNFVNSQTVWQCKQGDDKHAIFGIAVQEGNLHKIADNIKGIHTRRQMVIIDEATAVPAAIWDACTNLYGYPIDSGGEFVLVALANARNRIDQFGRFIEPEGGWDSVNIDTDEWETKPRLEDGKKVLVSRFDFRRSPNCTEPKQVSKFLPSKHRVELRMKSLRDRGAENDPQHYSNDLGFPPPEGLMPTVFTESLISKHGGYDRHTFNGENFRIIGAFDQARTGDRPALRFAAMGEIRPGVVGIEWIPAIILYADASNTKDPIAYQLMNQLRKHCENVQYRNQTYKCDPADLGIDCSNEATFGDLCQREWSPNIIRIQFGGACSEDPCSHEDPRPANEVYKNKRAEMFFRSKSATEAGQLKGIDKDTAAELITIQWSNLRPDGTTKLIVIQDKAEYKRLYAISPDLADSGVMILEVARLRGFRIIETGHTVRRAEVFDKVVHAANAVYDEITYSADNEDLDEVESL
jgi:hypothetical protein